MSPDFEERLRAYEPGADYPEPEARREELAFARSLVRRGAVPPERVLECFELQNLSLRFGVVPPPRVRQLLEAHGYPPATLDAAGDAPVPSEAADASRDPRNRFGKFVRTRLLGRGGMSEVWKAWDGRLGRWVALKFVREETGHFRREAQIAAALVHPNIAQVYEIVEEGEHVFLVLQLVEGETLEQGIEKRRFGPRAVARIGRDAALALEFAHQHGVVHRDLKPANLMIQSADPMRVYVMDFGLARRLAIDQTGSQSGTTVGTPQYMPPEQAAGELSRVDARSDVYSLGATLYHALTGRMPFRGRTHMEILTRVLRADLRPPSAYAAIAPELEAIVLKAMEPDPARRYASAGALAADLQRFLDGEPVSAKPAGAMRRLGRTLRRRAGVLVAAAALLVCGIFAFAMLRDRAERRRIEARATERDRADERRRELAPAVEKSRRYLDQAYKLVYESESPPEKAKDLARNAARELDRILEADPGLAPAWLERGRAHFLLGERDEAERCYTRAIECDAKFGVAYFERGLYRLHRYEDEQDILELAIVGSNVRRIPRAPDSASAAEHKRRAKEDFARMEALEVSEADQLFARGFALVLDERFEDAEPLLNVSLAKFELNADAWEYRAYCRMARGQMAAAREDWTKAIEIRRCWPRAWHFRGFASLCLGRPDESLDDFRRAIQLDPGNPTYYARRAIAYRQLRMPQKALDDLREALRLDERRPEVWFALGSLLYEAGEYAKAVEAYTRSIDLGMGAAAWSARGVARIAMSDYEAASADLGRSIELDPSSWYARFTRGRLRLHRKQADSAIEDFDAAARLNAEAHEVLFWRAKARLLQGNRDAAISDFELFLARAPHHAQAAEAKEELERLR